MPKKNEHVIIPKDLAVFQDKKTGVRTVAFPIKFPTGENGVISVTKLKNAPWNPADEIENILIKWII